MVSYTQLPSYNPGWGRNNFDLDRSVLKSCPLQEIFFIPSVFFYFFRTTSPRAPKNSISLIFYINPVSSIVITLECDMFLWQKTTVDLSAGVLKYMRVEIMDQQSFSSTKLLLTRCLHFWKMFLIKKFKQKNSLLHFKFFSGIIQDFCHKNVIWHILDICFTNMHFHTIKIYTGISQACQ